MVQQRWRRVQWTGSYALSKVELQHDALPGGERFPAHWDRRHQLTSHLLVRVGTGWMAYATEASNPWADLVQREPERLALYHRLDVGVQMQRTAGSVTVEAAASVANLYDRDNPWSRDPMAVIRTEDRPRFGFVFVDIYDLGLQPAFNVGVKFEASIS